MRINEINSKVQDLFHASKPRRVKFERFVCGWWWKMLVRAYFQQISEAEKIEAENAEFELSVESGNLSNDHLMLIYRAEEEARELRKSAAEMYKSIPPQHRDWAKSAVRSSTSKKPLAV